MLTKKQIEEIRTGTLEGSISDWDYHVIEICTMAMRLLEVREWAQEELATVPEDYRYCEPFCAALEDVLAIIDREEQSE